MAIAIRLPMGLGPRLIWTTAVFLAFVPAAIAAAQKPKVSRTVAELSQLLATSGSDDQIAALLTGTQLSEQLSGLALEHLRASLPGERSTQALAILADQSCFLDPPQTDIADRLTRDAASTRAMLVRVVNYVNTTLRQLPNFLVTKQTAHFEDRPQEDVLEATGTVSYSYQPMHFVGTSSVQLTYRNYGEVRDETVGRSMKQASVNAGLATTGEFGALLITVTANALKGKITWARWEKSDTGTLAVFRYSVPEEHSDYRVQFCCVVEGYNPDGQPDRQPYNEKVAYEGEIAFHPEDGTVMRMMLRAHMPEHGLVPAAGIVVEYGPIEIGGKTFVCPLRSISLLEAHTTTQGNTQSRSNYKGPVKTFLNESKFTSYRRFGTESRILTDSQ